MARTLSSRLRGAMQAQETGEVILAICRIEHPSILNGPLRVVNDLQNLVHAGDTYAGFPFQVTLPQDAEDGVPKIRLVLDSVDRTVVQAIRSIPPGTPPTVQVDLVLKSMPDVSEVTFPNLTLRNVTYDVFVVEGDLEVDEDDREPFPQHRFSPQLFPGVL